MKNVVIIENPSELGAGTRGSSLGIEAIKVAAFKARNDYFRTHDSVKIKDENHLLWDNSPYTNAKYIDGIYRVFEKVSAEVKHCLVSGKFPLVIAGDHSSAAATIAGIKMAYPDKRLGVVWIDAHSDLHSPYTSPSGNMHGMPLAISIGEDNLEQQLNTPKPETVDYWEKLKHFGGLKPKISPYDLVFICVRSAEDPEEHLIEKYGIKDFWIKEIRERGVKAIASETLDHLQDCDLIYISFDVDCLDSSVSEGTGTPVPGGLLENEAADLISQLLVAEKLVCFEIVEINPTLDNKGNVMAETALRILDQATNLIEERDVDNMNRSVISRKRM